MNRRNQFHGASDTAHSILSHKPQMLDHWDHKRLVKCIEDGMFGQSTSWSSVYSARQEVSREYWMTIKTPDMRDIRVTKVLTLGSYFFKWELW